MYYILELYEIGKETVWGGNSLAYLYSKPFELAKNIGESLEICDLKEGKNIISNGEFKGKTLSYLIENYGEEFLGSDCSEFIKEKYFPLLIKFIDAKDKLSIQVHPNEEYANKKHNKHGKNEMWYIMDAKNNPKLLIGLKEGIDKTALKNAIENKENIENMFNYFEVKKGDAYYIPSGCIHAILGNVIVAEIQTPSDITYRLYDWNRIDKNGKGRELHIEDSFNVIENIDSSKLKSQRINKLKNENLEINQIFSNKYFTTEEYLIKDNFSSKTNNKTFEIIINIEGSGIIESDMKDNIIELKAGKTVLIPASLGNYRIKSEKEMKFLRITI
ncbi:type I phosphomannose isomerase catalytic subunit [Brachyspira catarrhinii]|uniref:Phosphohexomutase n=1 Tax=Brachyspira catarrhinii TaxID=2528966 RepID=A0ABY2TUC4_9SPIR|nr:type I phosphomannose isomerase catalytic subunit [Brachyspira catarrhinii]TKZ36330.1 mannose-6-phosphate isomerase [Brachyspira catarrhinii]